MKLLEREIPFQALDNALKKATNGEGRVALVYGEAGIGKTSLVEQFMHQRREAVRVLWAICDALFTPHPLGPLQDIAAQVQSELLTLLRPESSRQAIFLACLSEIQRQPSIIVFEDVHWYAMEAIRLLETFPPGSELAMAYSNRALLHMLSNEVSEALWWSNKAITLAEKLGDMEILCHALNNVGTAETLAGHYEAGQAYEYHVHAARAYCNLAIQAVRNRDHGRAFRCFSDGIAYTT